MKILLLYTLLVMSLMYGFHLEEPSILIFGLNITLVGIILWVENDLH